MARAGDAGRWQAPNGEWHPNSTPPFYPDCEAPLPEGCPGPNHWQAPDGFWFSDDTPPYGYTASTSPESHSSQSRGDSSASETQASKQVRRLRRMTS